MFFRNNGIDISNSIRPNYEITRDHDSYSMLYSGHTLKNQQVFSSPVPHKKESLLPLRSDHALNYNNWIYRTPQKPQDKIIHMSDSASKQYGQLQPPPYRYKLVKLKYLLNFCDLFYK